MEPKKKSSWESIYERFSKVKEFTSHKSIIAFADVLGFKNLLDTKGAELLANNFHTFIMQAKEWALKLLVTEISSKGEITESITDIQSRIFSDSIVLWEFLPEFDEKINFSRVLNFLHVIGAFIGLAMKLSFPLRIGIAYGDCIIDIENEIFIGQPLVDAFSVEGALNWVGIGFHESCKKITAINEIFLRGKDIDGPIINYQLPIKDDKKDIRLITNWTVDWTIFTVEQFKNANEIERITIIPKNLKIMRDNAVDEKDKEKYLNTLLFFQERIQHREKIWNLLIKIICKQP